MDDKLALGIVLADKKAGGVLALDFDKVECKQVREEVVRLQEKFKLGNCQIVRSSTKPKPWTEKQKWKNYHAFFWWDWLSWEMIIKILRDAELVDPKFVSFKKKTGFLRIRGSPEAVHITIVHSNHQKEGGKEKRKQSGLYFGYKALLDKVRNLGST